MLPRQLVGAPIAVVADAEVSDEAIAEFLAAAEAKVAEIPVAVLDTPSSNEKAIEVPDRPAVSQSPQSGSDIPVDITNGEDDADIHATLHARRFATELGINLNNVTATGRNNRISRQDVINAVVAAGGSIEAAASGMRAGHRDLKYDAAGPGTSAPGISLGDLDPSLATDIPMNSMRRAISSRMTLSKNSAPHFRVVIDADIDQLLAARAELNASDEEQKVSVTDYLVKATAMALLEVPECNIQFDGSTIRRFFDAHISVAIALENGLVAPVVRNANSKTVRQISRDIASFVERAKTGSLAIDDLDGGTFTLSNLGAYGVKQFDAIINPPQGAILAVGRAERRYVERDGKPAAATILTLTLSADHRVIDGAVAAKMLQSLKSILGDPSHIG